MSLAAFLTAALESALDNEVATPDDVLRHATPDVLATHVPRTVWARLIKTCLEAPRVDARLVVETIGVKMLCDHVPPNIMYACLAEIAMRALGKGLVAAPPASVVAASAPVMPTPSGAPIPAMPPISRIATPPHGTRIDASGRVATPAAGVTTAAAAAATAAASTSTAKSVASGTPPKGTIPDPAAEVTRVAHPPADLSKIASEKSDMRGELTRVGGPPREPEPQPLGEPPAPPSRDRGLVESPAPSRGPGATTRANQATQPPAGGRRPQASAGAAATTSSARDSSAKLARGTPTSARRVSTATDFEIETDVNEQWKRTGQQPPASSSGAIDIQVDDGDLVDWSSSEETATNNDKYGKR